MTTTEHTILACFEEAHGALVCAAKEAHLTKHPQADNISKLIDVLEEIDLKIFPNIGFKKEEPNFEYVSAPVDIEYGTTDPTEPKENSKISCPSKPVRESFPTNEGPTPETDKVLGYLKMRTTFELTDHEVWESHSQKLEHERDEARNKMADALQEVDLRTLDFERMRQERDEACKEAEHYKARYYDVLRKSR